MISLNGATPGEKQHELLELGRLAEGKCMGPLVGNVNHEAHT